MFADVSSFGVELQWVIAIVLTVVLALLVFGLISFGERSSSYADIGNLTILPVGELPDFADFLSVNTAD